MALTNFRSILYLTSQNIYKNEFFSMFSIKRAILNKSLQKKNPLNTYNQSQYFCSSAKEKQQSTDDANPEKASEENEKLTSLEKELMEKNETLLKSVEEYKDKYQRSLADRENLRQRLEKQIQDGKLYGIQSFCKDLLEVSDVFRKALESVPEENVQSDDPVFKNLYDGVVMTENQLLSVFRRHGLEQIIIKEGDKFDTSTQEAMFEVPVSEGKQPGVVAHVLRNGWMLRDRCLRSAQVGIVKA